MDLPTLVAFDFDHTIVDDNTDIVVRKLLPEDQLTDDVQDLYSTSGWTTYMGKIFELLHKNLIGLKEIEAAIIDIQPTPGFDILLKELHSLGCEIIIISDSNSLFIDMWLKSKNLDNLISKVYTNPAHISDDGILKINMYHVQDSCELSTINLCKGRILEDHIKERLEKGIQFKRIAYVGDGKNDLCPILRLSKNDLAFARVHYPLMKKLNEYNMYESSTIEATIFPWSNGLEILTHLIERINMHCNKVIKNGLWKKSSACEVHTVLKLFQEKFSTVKIAKTLNRSKNIISKLVKNPDNYDSENSSEHPPVLTSRQIRAIL